MSRPNSGEPEHAQGARWSWDKVWTSFFVIWMGVVVVAVFLSIDDQISGPKPGDDSALALLISVGFLVLLIQGVGLLVYPTFFARGADAAVTHWPRRIGFVTMCGGLFGVVCEVGRAFAPSLVAFISQETFNEVIFGLVGVLWVLKMLARRHIQT